MYSTCRYVFIAVDDIFISTVSVERVFFSTSRIYIVGIQYYTRAKFHESFRTRARLGNRDNPAVPDTLQPHDDTKITSFTYYYMFIYTQPHIWQMRTFIQLLVHLFFKTIRNILFFFK